MSLFRSREWWAVNLNENEMYDSQCLLTTSIGDDNFQSILLGNHKGVLRLFSPNSDLVEGVLSYKPSHLLLEVQLGSPILQISEGYLVSGSMSRCVAILHPRLFSVYILRKKESKETNIGDQVKIELAYQHVLRHSAHSFVLGPFGGVRDRNFICIQSLDGLISFYEQESFAFQLYLPNFSLPSRFSYLEKIDSFLFLNGLLILDCYSYESLASSGNSNDKKISKSWSYNLGEDILDMNVVAKNNLLVIILSEKNFHGINDNGKMIFMKRLESKPVALYSYLTEESKSLMIMVATEEGFINFYEEVSLKWSMKLDIIPISIKRIFISTLSGGIALLSENGFLQIVYIGTHPSVYLVPQLVQSEIDIEKAQLQLQLLQRKIADNDLDSPTTTDLTVNLKIDKTEVHSNSKSCKVMVEISAVCLVNKIQVLFIVEPPITVKSQSEIIFDCHEDSFIENSVTVNNSCVISSLTMRVVVTYQTSKGNIKSIQKSGTLPLDLVVSETVPVKETRHKITITTNKPVSGMNQLFREFTPESTSGAMGLKLDSGDVVSVLAAKSFQRYRLQSDSLAAITIVLQALLERLKQNFQKDSDFNVTYSGSLPVDEFYEKIILHQDLIQKRNTMEEILSKQTAQYIVIQKKILTKLKDVAPKTASNLYNILQDTSKMIQASGEELESIEKNLISSRSCLRSLCRLMITLMELMHIRREDLKFIKVIFNPYVQDTDDQGWLEVQEATISFLLRTALAKSIKDQQKPVEVLLEPLTDISKLTKHFTSVIERVTKGTYLLERNDYEGNKELVMSVQAAYESDEGLFEDIFPVATKFLSIDSKMKKITSKSELHRESQCLLEVQENEEERGECSKSNTDIVIATGEKIMENQESLPLQESISDTYEGKRNENQDENDGIWDVKVMEMRI